MSDFVGSRAVLVVILAGVARNKDKRVWKKKVVQMALFLSFRKILTLMIKES
jgi:hypothetical protein